MLQRLQKRTVSIKARTNAKGLSRKGGDNAGTGNLSNMNMLLCLVLQQSKSTFNVIVRREEVLLYLNMFTMRMLSSSLCRNINNLKIGKQQRDKM